MSRLWEEIGVQQELVVDYLRACDWSPGCEQYYSEPARCPAALWTLSAFIRGGDQNDINAAIEYLVSVYSRVWTVVPDVSADVIHHGNPSPDGTNGEGTERVKFKYFWSPHVVKLPHEMDVPSVIRLVTAGPRELSLMIRSSQARKTPDDTPVRVTRPRLSLRYAPLGNGAPLFLHHWSGTYVSGLPDYVVGGVTPCSATGA